MLNPIFKGKKTEMKHTCFPPIRRICFEFSLMDTQGPPTWRTVSNENQGRLAFGFPVLNLHGVGALVINGEPIHHHLDDASGLVTLDSVCLGGHRGGENPTFPKGKTPSQSFPSGI